MCISCAAADTRSRICCKNISTKKHTGDKYCDMCKENFKTDNELIDHKQLLHTTSVNVTDDEHVLVDRIVGCAASN